MKKFLSILAILAAVVLAPSCQKELPDAIKNIEVNKGDQTPTPTPSPTPAPMPDNPTDSTQQGGIPSEEDILWPGY